MQRYMPSGSAIEMPVGTFAVWLWTIVMVSIDLTSRQADPGLPWVGQVARGQRRQIGTID